MVSERQPQLSEYDDDDEEDDDDDDDEELFDLVGKSRPPQKTNILDYRYRDGSAILSILLKDDEVAIERTAFPNPSTSYVMQETVVVNGVLDELHQCAFDESVTETDRLLLLPDRHKGAIEEAREALAFG